MEISDAEVAALATASEAMAAAAMATGQSGAAAALAAAGGAGGGEEVSLTSPYRVTIELDGGDGTDPVAGLMVKVQWEGAPSEASTALAAAEAGSS